MEFFRAIQRELGAIFIYVTHDQTEAMVMSDRIAVMNQGRIIQEGSAREIYMRPTSVFASDFIGDTNLIVGSVANVGDRTVTLTVPGGAQLEGESSDELASGSPATLSVRPESVRLAGADPSSVGEPGSQGRRGLPGTITDVIYLGNRVRIEIATDNEVTLIADLRDEDSTGFERGTMVRASWEPTAATVWAGDQGDAIDQPEIAEGGRA